MKTILLKTSILFCLLTFLWVPAHTASNRHDHPATQQTTSSEARTGFFKKHLVKHFHRAPAKKKTDKLAIAVFVGGLAAFLLFFPFKLFWAFVIVGVATLIAAVIALRRLRRRDDLGGKWLVFLGMALVIVPAAFIGLVLWALSRW